MRPIVVVNPNSNPAVTAGLDAALEPYRAVRPVDCVTLAEGPFGIQSQADSDAVILPLYFTASSVFPLDPALTRAQTLVTYPEWLVIIVEHNPLTYAVDAMRGILIKFNQFDPALGFQVVGIMAVGLFLLAMWEFRKV